MRGRPVTAEGGNKNFKNEYRMLDWEGLGPLSEGEVRAPKGLTSL